MSAGRQNVDAPTASPAGRVPLSSASKAEAAPATARRLRRLLSLDDFEMAARRHLPFMLYSFIAGGAENGAAVRANRASYEAYSFVPRVLADVSGRTQATTLFGKRYAAPFGIAPMGAGAICAYRNDIVLARAAAAAKIPMVLSASSLIRLEEVRQEGPTAWYQAYLPGETDRIAALVDRVAAAGYDTFVLTADVPVAANRENNTRNGFNIPLKPSPRLVWEGMTHPAWLLGTALPTLLRHGMPHFENMDAARGPPILSRNLLRALGKRDQLAWRHVEFIRQRWPGHLVIKGVLSREDARIARESGVDGVVVSNHGGRQLDGAASPMQVLPDIAAEANGMAVMLDGGIRRGTDVLKALALGADFVFLGRPFLYAAAVAGEAGLRHAIGLLSEEIDRDLALLGIRELSQLGPDALIRSASSGTGEGSQR